jgi:hypothetical protein
VLPFDVNNIFATRPGDFTDLCRHIYAYQYWNNPVYRQWCSLLGEAPRGNETPATIPALPIGLFKTHRIYTGEGHPDRYFESSGTTQTANSRHWVKDPDLYRKSFFTAFEQFYGPVGDWCILGLLPAYLERQHSSLVMMVDELIKACGHPDAGFYLYDHAKLATVLASLEQQKQQTLLIGVTFALLDFASAYPMPLSHTTIMETGGMKGRRQELTRAAVHEELMRAWGVHSIHSEYGMTELLSQAYSAGNGRFYCPPWMRVLVRDEEDPRLIHTTGKGILQVIDLANVHSCSFLATEDVGIVYEDGSFEVWGRLDHSDIRGCSLLVV